MGVLLRVWSVFVVAIKRLLTQRWLTLATMLGLVASVALALSIPLYAEGVYHRVLTEKLTGEPSLGLREYPPFAFMFRYIGGSFATLQWEEVATTDVYLSGAAWTTLGLPQKFLVRHQRTGNASPLVVEVGDLPSGIYALRILGEYDRMRWHERVVIGH